MGSQRLFEGLHLLCPKKTSGPFPAFLSDAALGSGAGRAGGSCHPEAGPTVRFLPFLGDVGSFIIKLVEGLQGQMWSSDWAEELRKADQQKEQTYRSVWVKWTRQE